MVETVIASMAVVVVVEGSVDFEEHQVHRGEQLQGQ